jgi:hypothetical protein
MRIKTMLLASVLSVIGIGTASAAPIKIGVDIPLSGTYAGIGQQVRWGYELATKEINAKCVRSALKPFYSTIGRPSLDPELSRPCSR